MYETAIEDHIKQINITFIVLSPIPAPSDCHLIFCQKAQFSGMKLMRGVPRDPGSCDSDGYENRIHKSSSLLSSSSPESSKT
jgi:hypothetical protein